jgi:hypothetical protein
MSINLYLVDFPSEKQKFWKNSIKEAVVTSIERAQLEQIVPEQNAQDIYLFYIKDKNSLNDLDNQWIVSNSSKFYYGLLLINQELLKQLSPNAVLERQKLVLLSADSPELNLGNIITLNHILTSHRKEFASVSKFKNKIQELSTQFDVAIERLEKQLMLARQKFFAKDHAKPIKYNTIQFDYTYRAGNKPGTEYSDFIFWNEWTLWLNFSSTSYAESSIILKFIEDCRKEKDYWSAPQIQEIFNLFQKTVSSFQTVMNQNLDADYFVCLINTKQRNAEYIFKGSYECYNQLGALWAGRQDQPAFHKKNLSAGEKFLLLTPGLFRNILNESKKNSLRNYVKANLQLLRQEILSEIFLTVEKDQSNFLDYDMNVVYGEVAK